MINKISVAPLLIMGLLTFPLSGYAHSTSSQPTPGVQSALSWANELKGQDYRTHPEFPSYCNTYATIAIRQANRRIDGQCTHQIPASNGRWGQDKWRHRHWCLGVSAYASEREIRTRENQLRNCHKHDDRITRAHCIQNDRMHAAAVRGDINFVRQCLNIGVSPDIREGNNWTPMHSAARNGRHRIVRLLIRRGGHVNARDVTGRTPLDQAKIAYHHRVIDLLEDNGGTSRD